MVAEFLPQSYRSVINSRKGEISKIGRRCVNESLVDFSVDSLRCCVCYTLSSVRETVTAAHCSLSLSLFAACS